MSIVPEKQLPHSSEEVNVPKVILEQLGGNKFLAMTGAKGLVADGNTLRMSLPKNMSRANRLYITLDNTDTYTMRFFHYSMPRLNHKTMTWSAERVKDVAEYTDVYCDGLAGIFTKVTGMDTHL